VVKRKDLLAMLFLTALVLVAFWRATLGGIFYFGDIFQLHYPLRSAYAQELLRFSLPLWTPHVLAGYPLLAEGQLGALYPPNLILHALLPVPLALNAFILGHLVLAAIGTYVFGRRLEMSNVGASCAAVVYTLGGFLVAHLNHVNIIACAAWLPFLFLLTNRLLKDTPSRHWRDASWLALVVGLEFLAGHPQMALLSLLALVAYAVYLARSCRRQLRIALLFTVSLLLGTALAAAQLLPTYELTQISVRSEGLDPALSTSFSLHPFYLISLVWPFLLGNPYPNVSVELVGYVGILPLLLAMLAPFVARTSSEAEQDPAASTRFFAVLAAIALLLSFGRWNPAYAFLSRLPIFNLFRVPARYLYWFSFSVALLAGFGLDGLFKETRRLAQETGLPPTGLPVLAVALLAQWGVARLPEVDSLVAAWTWLPVLLGLLALGWLAWARWGRTAHALRATAALALVVVDFMAFGAVFNLTYNQVMPRAQFSAAPRSLSFFRAQEGIYRVYTHEEIVPVLSVMRESYYPNLSLIYGLSSANGLFPLLPARYAQYVEQMTPRMLDLLGVRYFIIPQVLPVDEASEFYDLENPFALNPVGRQIPITPTMAVTLELESYVSHSVEWSDGREVAEIVLLGAGFEQQIFTLRAGWHTAEWAYDRSDVASVVRHRQPAIARSWPARSGFPPEDHTGYTYRAELRLPAPLTVQSVAVRPLIPSAYLRIERLFLVDADGKRYLLSHLAGMSDQTLVYRSEDAAVYENHDVLPRVFVVHQARSMVSDDQTLEVLRQSDFDPRTEVLLASVQPTRNLAPADAVDKVELLLYDAGRIVIHVESAADGYLVLTDAWYPGWRVTIDGREQPVLRANLIFRAVSLSAGEHTVEFTYAPKFFYIGLCISASTMSLLVGIWIWSELSSRRNSRQ